MAATSTPYIYDPKCLAQVSSLSTSANTTIYTAPSAEEGAQIDLIVICNKTGSASTISLDHYNGATGYNIFFTVPIAALETIFVRGPIFLDTADLLRGSAGNATTLDINVYGVELSGA
jgi:hypothetical protein